jgi:hypothetical protein
MILAENMLILLNLCRSVNARKEKIRRLLHSPGNQDIMLSVFFVKYLHAPFGAPRAAGPRAALLCSKEI